MGLGKATVGLGRGTAAVLMSIATTTTTTTTMMTTTMGMAAMAAPVIMGSSIVTTANRKKKLKYPEITRKLLKCHMLLLLASKVCKGKCVTNKAPSSLYVKEDDIAPV